MPPAETSGAHIHAICGAAPSIEIEDTLHTSSLDTEVVLTFGARHDAALSRHELSKYESPIFHSTAGSSWPGTWDGVGRCGQEPSAGSARGDDVADATFP